MPSEYVIVTAGGMGSRMGGEVPKQFLPLNGVPVLMHSLKAFYQYSPRIGIILTLPTSQVQAWEELRRKHHFTIELTICHGGETRFDSVKNGLAMIQGEGLVAVHDAVRPLVSVALIERCFRLAAIKGNAVPAIPLTDSAREVMNGDSRPVDRERLRLVQTPQVFHIGLLKSAYDQACRSSFTDDASVVEALGSKINLVEGDPVNLKITRPDDLFLAEALGPHRSPDL